MLLSESLDASFSYLRTQNLTIMASSFLHQALFILPKSPVQSASANMYFSAAPLPRRSISVGLVSRVPTRHFALNFTEKVRNRSLLVRAEPEEIEVNAEVVETGEVAVVVSDEKPARQPRTKLGDIMGILNKRAVDASDKERPIPDLRTGDIVEVKLEVPENKRRLSVYKGIIISRQNAGIHTTIRIRRIIAGVGVEIVFPIYSPNIKEIKVVKHRKVRRARLYYLRDKLPRLSTFK